jgi:hypothetical protein
MVFIAGGLLCIVSYIKNDVWASVYEWIYNIAYLCQMDFIFSKLLTCILSGITVLEKSLIHYLIYTFLIPDFFVQLNLV